MKGDYSRLTFDPVDNVRAVTYQQGRPIDDASLNEAAAVTLRRIETEALDVIGRSGAPAHGGGFRIVKSKADLTAEEQADPRNAGNPAGPPLTLLTAGRLYVDGVQVENHALAAGPTIANPGVDGRRLVYLKVTIDHRTGLEMERLLDPAFGDADTTARTLVTWQVRALDVAGNLVCSVAPQAWTDLPAAVSGRVSVTVDTTTQATDPCKLTAGAGYTRTENLLYRLEVDGGTPTAMIDGEAIYGLEGLQIKVSRNNAAEVTRVASVNGARVTVTTGTRDGMPVFNVGEFVEVLSPGDVTDAGDPLGWATVLAVDGETLELQVGHPAVVGCRLRQWTARRTLTVAQPRVELDGLVIEFKAGSYRRGTYFLVPARYATRETLPTHDKLSDLAPSGPEVHYVRLGLVDLVGGVVSKIVDCRPVFTPLTEQWQFLYAGGDGQDGPPGVELPQRLRVRVADGLRPLVGQAVRFTIESGAGGLQSAAVPGEGLTDDRGIASARWTLGPDVTVQRHQRVCAELLDDAGVPRPGCVLYFAATASALLVAHDGDGQEAEASQPLPLPLRVRLSNGPTPVPNARVEFAVDMGGGQITAQSMATDAQGMATAEWTLGPDGVQRVVATWFDAAGTAVQTVAFDAQIEAPAHGGCAVTIGEGGVESELTVEVLDALRKKYREHVCICLLPGVHRIGKLDVDGRNELIVSIHGCGPATHVEFGDRVSFTKMRALEIAHLSARWRENAALIVTNSRRLTLRALDGTFPERNEAPIIVADGVPMLDMNDVEMLRERPSADPINVLQVEIQKPSDVVDTAITGCHLQGAVVFGGDPIGGAQAVMLGFVTPALAKALRPGALRFEHPNWRLRVQGNRLDRLAIGKEAAKRVRTAAANPVDPPPLNLPAVTSIADNVFEASATEFATGQLTVSGNTWVAQMPDVATFLAGSAAVSGNTGYDTTDAQILRIVTPRDATKCAANLIGLMAPSRVQLQYNFNGIADPVLRAELRKLADALQLADA